jgi:hypothetical protein
MCRHILLFLIIFFISLGLFPSELITEAERSNFQRTSDYNDVMTFLFEAQKRSDRIQVIRLTTSFEGRMIPLVVISNEGIKSPGELRLTHKPPVLIMANIHAGEVEGKEAALMLLREIVTHQADDILDHQVILVIPIFNPDGNEKFGNNRRDNGPELAGVRHNGQYLDLNRDYLKLESPEVKALVKLFIEWDPIMFADLHTTNGSYHREPVTYTTLVNSNSDERLSQYMWKQFFPAVSGMLKEKYGYDSIPYGNFVDRAHPEKGWRNHAFAARYGNNYAGLRNRFTVLVENYAYADFKTRVLGCFGFIKSILYYTNKHIREMEKMVTSSDLKTQTDYFKETFDLEFENEKLLEFTIKSYQFKVEKIKPEDRHKYPPWRNDYIVEKTDTLKDYKVDYFSKPVPKKSIPLPEAYIILPYHDTIVKNLKNHGIIVEKIRKPITASMEYFVMEEIKLAQRIYQGHIFIDIKGHYEKKEIMIPENSHFISMRQPLARLIPVLLEPESEDSLLRWGFFNREIVRQWSGRPASYPVYRLNTLNIQIERYQE